MLDHGEIPDAAGEIHPLFHGAAKTTAFAKLRERLMRQTREAVERHGVAARGQGCSAVVPGHHRDALLVPPSHVVEADCDRFARAVVYPIAPCDLCGTQGKLQRPRIKAMLIQHERRSPGRRATLLAAPGRAWPPHPLASALFGCAALAATDAPRGGPASDGNGR